MKRTSVLVWGFALLSAVGMFWGVKSLAAPRNTGKWTPLFNGKNLDGWQPSGEETWVADHGTIFGESTSGKYGYLVTKKTYKDFDIRLKFNCTMEGNSGLFFHSQITGESPKSGPDIVGLQAEIDPARHSGGIYESGGRGWVALPTAEGEKAIKPVGQWNTMEVRAEGNHFVTHLNGVKIVDYMYTPAKYTDGHIALQIHTGQNGFRVRFKDIEIRTLP
jgi:3-keto-disaccharide hydrolase